MSTPNLNVVASRIIEAAFKVAETLGYGFLEEVYQNALCVELHKRGIVSRRKQSVPIYYEENEVGMYVADLLVEDEVVITVKAVQLLDAAHEAQVMNCLKASGAKIGLLFNFGAKNLEFKRLSVDAEKEAPAVARSADGTVHIRVGRVTEIK